MRRTAMSACARAPEHQSVCRWVLGLFASDPTIRFGSDYGGPSESHRLWLGCAGSGVHRVSIRRGQRVSIRRGLRVVIVVGVVLASVSAVGGVSKASAAQATNVAVTSECQSATPSSAAAYQAAFAQRPAALDRCRSERCRRSRDRSVALVVRRHVRRDRAPRWLGCSRMAFREQLHHGADGPVLQFPHR